MGEQNGLRKAFYQKMVLELSLSETDIRRFLSKNYPSFDPAFVEEYETALKNYAAEQHSAKVDRLTARYNYLPSKCPVCDEPIENGTEGWWKCKGSYRHYALWRTSQIALAVSFKEMRKAWCLEQERLKYEKNKQESPQTDQ